MSEDGCLESFPAITIVLGTMITITSVFLGAAVIFFFDLVFSMVYVGLYVVMTILNVRFRCNFCYYCGKRCPSGMGKLVKKEYLSRYNREFNNPVNYGLVGVFSFAMMILPIVIGIIALFLNFVIIQLVVLIFYCIVSFVPNAFLKGDRCKKCKQGKLGCPAMRKTQEKEEFHMDMDEDLEN